jgi:hypothetical protein
MMVANIRLTVTARRCMEFSRYDEPGTGPNCIFNVYKGLSYLPQGSMSRLGD